jgi:hypothetical protein
MQLLFLPLHHGMLRKLQFMRALYRFVVVWYTRPGYTLLSSYRCCFPNPAHRAPRPGCAYAAPGDPLSLPHAAGT